MTNVIDQTRALSLLARVTEERGAEFVYERIAVRYPSPTDPDRTAWVCNYEHGGAPSCGVGLALHFQGVSIETLAAMDQGPEDDSSINSEQVAEILEAAGFTMDHGAVLAFSTFQTYQDTGAPYSQALSRAIAAVTRGV